MKQEHVKIIGEFYQDPSLFELSIYNGYKGGIVLRIRTASKALLEEIDIFCTLNKIEVNTSFNKNLHLYEIYCIAEQDDIYRLKE